MEEARHTRSGVLRGLGGADIAPSLSVLVALAAPSSIPADYIESLQAAGDIDVVFVSGPLQQARDAAESLSPDIVVLDGEILREAVEQGGDLSACTGHDCRVIVASRGDCEHLLAGCLQAGVRGCVVIGTRPEELVRAIRAVKAGEWWFGRRILSSLLEDLMAEPAASPDERPPIDADAELPADPARPPLTDRERQVVQLAARGLTNKEAARELGISPKTVKAHLSRAFQKLHVHRRSRLARRYR